MLRLLQGSGSWGWRRKLPLGIAAGFLMAILAVWIQPASAQVLYGDLTGNVTDQTGAVVPNAAVDAMNAGTGLSTDTKTDDHGVFEFTDLTPGVYNLTITAAGLGTSVQQGLRVEANNVVRADTVLAVSGTISTVTVTATAPVLQADRADVHTDLNETELSNLPLNSSQGRNFQILYKVIPGFSTPTEQNSAGANPQRAMTSYVNGQSDQGNTMRIDGMTDVYNYLPANVAYVPPPDSIETVNIVTDAFDAEQGMAGGAAINVTIKSGTNQLHGGAFYSHNDQHMTALPYFTQVDEYSGSNCVVAVSVVGCGDIKKNINNQIAANVGGPIKKNKLFFFGDYERTVQRQNASVLQAIPGLCLFAAPYDTSTACNTTAATTTGFSNAAGITFPTAANGGANLYEPWTGNPDGTDRVQFPGNTIPIADVNPAALDYLKYLATPAGAAFSQYAPAGGNNYENDADGNYTRNDIDSKFTYLPNSKSTLFARYSESGSDILDPPSLGVAGGEATNGGQQGNAAGRIQVVGVGGTYAFTPAVIMDGNVGYARQRLSALNLDLGTNYGLQFGIPNTNGTTTLEGGFPSFLFAGVPGTLAGGTGLGDPTSSNPFLFRDNQYVGDLNVSWQKHTHALRFGFERVHWALNHFQPQGAFGPRGAFTFNGELTSLNCTTTVLETPCGPGVSTSVPNGDNEWADFLLGLPNSSGKTGEEFDPNTERESQWSLYAQDQWQVSQKLTISYGIRWEYYPFVTHADYEGSPFGVPLFNPATGQIAIGGMGSTPLTDGVKTTPQFAPRFGLAYRLTPKTVIRAGYGMSIDPSNFRDIRDVYPSDVLESNNASGLYAPSGILSAPATGAATVCTTTCTIGSFTGIPIGLSPLVSPNISSGSITLPNTGTTFTYPQNYNRGYIESFNLTVQRELGAGFNWQVAYVRTLGIRLQADLALNYSEPGQGTSGPLLAENAALPNLFAPAPTNWGAITIQGPYGTASYNALQTQLSHRIGNGGFFAINYAYSKAIDNINGDNDDGSFLFPQPTYFARNRADSGFDQTNNLEILGVEPSPFGKNGHWMKHGAASAILGGWQLNEVLTKTSGMPFTVTGSSGTLNAAASTQLANQILPNVAVYGNIGTTPKGPACVSGSESCTYFNTAAFAQVAACGGSNPIGAPYCGIAFGDTGRDEFRGPGIFNLDMSVSRAFPIREQMSLLLELQAFSLTNTPHFANPNGTCCTGTFGEITSTLGSSGSGASGVSSGARQLWVSAKFVF